MENKGTTVQEADAPFREHGRACCAGGFRQRNAGGFWFHVAASHSLTWSGGKQRQPGCTTRALPLVPPRPEPSPRRPDLPQSRHGPKTTRNLDRSKSPEAQLRRRRRKLSRCGAKMLRPARRSCGGSRVKMRWDGAPPGRSGCRQHPSLARIRPRLASAKAATTARPGPAWLDR